VIGGSLSIEKYVVSLMLARAGLADACDGSDHAGFLAVIWR
jgi:hypothetical protein